MWGTQPPTPPGPFTPRPPDKPSQSPSRLREGLGVGSGKAQRPAPMQGDRHPLAAHADQA